MSTSLFACTVNFSEPNYSHYMTVFYAYFTVKNEKVIRKVSRLLNRDVFVCVLVFIVLTSERAAQVTGYIMFIQGCCFRSSQNTGIVA